MKELPEPECSLGYPLSQIENIMGDRIQEFNHWMFGQTMAICDGRSYDNVTEKYYFNDCGPHGSVVYSWDLIDFLLGRPVTD